MAMLFLSCKDNYKRVGDESAPLIFPQWVAEDFVLTYTETKNEVGSEGAEGSRVIAVLTSRESENFENLPFKYSTFPKGLQVDFYDDQNNKSVIKSDYGIIYSDTNLIDLQGNVVIETHDGKILETPQLYWDRASQWIFTQAKFKYTNPEEGTIMDGVGMDFNQDFSFLNAHKTNGLMSINEE